MKNLTLSLIDFSSIELQADSNIIINEPSIYYKNIKHNLEGLEGSNNFELWFDNLLWINYCILYHDISIEESLDLCSSLKKVEESNKELQELIRIWKEDESNISTVQRFMINDVIIDFYECLITNIYENEFFELDSFNSLVEDYKPRLFEISYLKSSDNIKITKEDDAKHLQQMWLKTGLHLINKHFGVKSFIDDNGNEGYTYSNWIDKDNFSLNFFEEDFDVNECFGSYSPYGFEFLNEIILFYFLRMMDVHDQEQEFEEKIKDPRYMDLEGFDLEDNVHDHECVIEGKNIKFTTDSILEIVEVNGEKVERPYFLNYEDD